MKNLKISLKLLVSFSVLLVMSVVLSAVGFVGMLLINDASEEMHDNNLISISHLQTLSLDYQKQRSAYRDLVMYEKGTDEYNSSVEVLASCYDEVNKTISNYQSIITDKVELKYLEDFENYYNQFYTQIAQPILNYCNQNDNQSAINVINSTKDIPKQVDNFLNQLVEFNEVLAETAVKNNSNLFNAMIIALAAVLVISIFFALFLMKYVTSLIAKPINLIFGVVKQVADKGDLRFEQETISQMQNYAKAADEVGQTAKAFDSMMLRLIHIGDQLNLVSNGDLTPEITLLSPDDRMGVSLKNMIDNLNSMFNSINISADQVNSGAEQVSSASQNLSQGATEQASAIEQLSASISQINSQIKQNADESIQANTISEETMNEVEVSNKSMQDMLGAMTNINTSSNEISKIIKVIEDIAFQTNILALNAAVEAARAGEAGKGFAVVADEVRSLASKSANAAKQTTALIEGSVKSVSDGVVIAQNTAQSLRQVASKTKDVSEMIKHISDSSTEQAQGIMQINQGVEQISMVVQTNSATAEQSAAASEELSGQSNMLKQEISKFKLKASKSTGKSLPSVKVKNTMKNQAPSSAPSRIDLSDKY